MATDASPCPATDGLHGGIPSISDGLKSHGKPVPSRGDTHPDRDPRAISSKMTDGLVIADQLMASVRNDADGSSHEPREVSS
jgi:hypothetical protein